MSKISLDAIGTADSSSDTGPQDRRRANRSALTVRIDYATVDEIFSEFTRDINEGGLFIETEKPHLPGTEVSMQFHLPGSDEVVETIGRGEEPRILPVVLWLGHLPDDRVGLEPTIFVEPIGQLHLGAHSSARSPAGIGRFHRCTGQPVVARALREDPRAAA